MIPRYIYHIVHQLRNISRLKTPMPAPPLAGSRVQREVLRDRPLRHRDAVEGPIRAKAVEASGAAKGARPGTDLVQRRGVWRGWLSSPDLYDDNLSYVWCNYKLHIAIIIDDDLTNTTSITVKRHRLRAPGRIIIVVLKWWWTSRITPPTPPTINGNDIYLSGVIEKMGILE